MIMWQKKISWLWITLAVVCADRITKWLIVKYIVFAQAIAIFPGFNLVQTHNTGAAFSFLQQAGGWQQWLFGAIAVGVSIYLVVWLLRLHETQRWMRVAMALIIGGALGNLYDRLVYGYVIDFLDFYIANWHYPAFNVADSAICVGAIMLMVRLIWQKKLSGA